MKISLACNALLLGLCLFLFSKLYIFQGDEVSKTQPLTASTSTASVETVPVPETQKVIELPNQEPREPNENAVLPTQSLADLGNAQDISEQDLADIALHLKDVQPSSFKPPLADIEAHQRDLELESAAQIN